MHGPTELNRRTVLQLTGAGLAGSAVLSGLASAHRDNGNDQNNRRQDSFSWARDTLYEMLEPEPPENNDSEGNEESHRPLWIVGSMEDTDLPGHEHSPHPNPLGLPIDHVVPLVDFSAQWHVHLVTTDLSDPLNPENIPTHDSDGNTLTSASTITAAAENGDVHVIEVHNPETGEPEVFTCPIRPHNGPGVEED